MNSKDLSPSLILNIFIEAGSSKESTVKIPSAIIIVFPKVLEEDNVSQSDWLFFFIFSSM